MIRLEGVSRIYDLGEVQIAALAEVNLGIERGEFLTVMGPSGSGKSTLLHILGMLDSPTRAPTSWKVTRSRISRSTRSRGSATSTSGSCSRASTCFLSSVRWRT